MRLEQEKQVPDQVTREQIADLVDAIFEISPCTNAADTQGGRDLDPVPSVSGITNQANAVQALASQAFELPICSAGGMQFGVGLETGSYDANVRVYRSHVCEDYTLRLAVGNITGTTRVQEDIHITVQVDGTSTTLDLPISVSCDPNDTYIYKFESSAPVKSRSGSTIEFEGYVSVLHLFYTTEYDRVGVNIPGNGEMVPSHAFCTCMGLNNDIRIEPPDRDDDGNPACLTSGGGTIGSGGTGDGGTPSGELPEYDGNGPKCYQTTTHEQRCVCTGSEHDSYDTEREVNCPSDETDGAHGVGDHLTSVSYVDCGIVDEYGTPEFYEKKCCHPGSPPVRCKEQHSVWSGGSGNSDALDAYRDEPNVSFIPVGPKGGICGEMVVTQKVTGSCCEDAEPLVVTSMGSDKIRPGGSVAISIEGDVGPIKWQANGGYEMAFDETGTPGANIVYANEDGMCTDARVIIKGQCDSINLIIPRDEDYILPLEIETQEPIESTADAYVLVTATGGVLPYKWSSSKLELISEGGNGAVFLCPSDFCGMANVSVTDECDDTDSVRVKSTAGHWELVPDFNQCSPPGTYTAPGGPPQFQYNNVVSNDGEWRVSIWNQMVGWKTTCDSSLTTCGKGNVIMEDSYFRDYCLSGPDTTYASYCCTKEVSSDPPTYNYLIGSQSSTGLYRWECP